MSDWSSPKTILDAHDGLAHDGVTSDRLQRTTRRLIVWGVAVALLALTGCSEEIVGPEPTLDAPSDQITPLPVAPGIVCSEQLTTDVVVTGDEFSPLVIDSLEDESRVELPTIALKRSQTLTGEQTEAEEVVYSGDPDAPTNMGLLSWQSQNQMTFTVNQELELADGASGILPSGIHDVTVRNASDNQATSQGSLAVAPRPVLEDIGPSIVCLAEEERTVTLSGSTFLEINGERAHVEAEGVADPFEIDFDDANCDAIAHDGIDARTCDSADLTLSPGSLEVGYPALTLQNPPTAQCNSEDDINLRVVPPPAISSIIEPMACVAQGERTFEIRGSDFLQIDGQTPTVTVDGTEFDAVANDCADLETLNHDVQLCSTLTMVVGEDAVDPGRLEVVVSNPEPAGCSNQDSAFVTITPPPTLAEVVPPAVCVQDGPRQVTLVGSDFITVDGTVPAVEFDGVAVDAADISAEGCSGLEVDDLDVETCNELVVTVTDTELDGDPTYNPSITVTNPDPAGCNDTQEGLLTVMDGPTIDSAEPSLACTDDGDRDIVISGTNFLTVDGAVPAVSFDGTDVDPANVAASDCSPDDTVAGGLTVESCTTLTVTAEQGTLAPGDTNVVVTNPDPVGCDVSNDVILTVPPELMIDSVDPANICVTNTGQNTIEISGTGFLKVDGDWFDLEVDGDPITVTDADVADCTALDVDGHTVESCETIVVDVDTTGKTAGALDITITNAGEATCGATFSDKFGVADPPTLTSIAPAAVCADTATTFTLTGTNFAQGMIVRAHHSDGTTVEADSVTFVDSTEVEAEFASGLADGSWDIEVDNGDSCASTQANALTVNPTPVVFFVDPPVLYNGITTEVTIFTSGLSATPTSIDFIDSNGNVEPITAYSSTQPNRIQATVPSGLAADTYSVEITSQHGCTGGLPGAVEITDQTTVAINGIDPTFGWQDSPTSVRITADDTAPAADQFQATPRVYLNPVTGGAGSTATELRATTFDSSTELSGIVASGLSLGEYDVIVVNPDGTVGVLTDANNDPSQGAFEVLDDPPPVIDSVDPGTWPDNEVSSGAIRGEHFRLDETVNATPVTVECINPSGGTETLPQAAITIDFTNVTGTEIPFTIDMNNANVSKGSVCEVTVTNTDDTFAQFAPVAISWPASAWRLGPFQAAPDLNTARRMPSSATGLPSRKQRFVYAIGGDDGDADNALESVEFSRLDRFGAPLGFSDVPRHSLPDGGMTLTHTVRIGEFLYNVGGYKGTAATNPGATGQVLRTKVLDPLNVPTISGVDFEFSENNGLDTGTYYYRVSAVLDTNSAYNPEGETLASEPLPIAVPDAVDGDLVPTITWDEFPDADSYRVYRSPAADNAFGQEILIAEVTDDGSQTYSLEDDNLAQLAAENPLPVGALGEWHEPNPAATITARHSHGVTMVRDPADTDTYHIYAVGGLDATDTALDSVDYVTIQVGGPRDHTVVAAVNGVATISQPRFELQAAMATSSSVPGLADPPLLYVLGGYTGAGLTNDLEYFEVGAGGTLTNPQAFATNGLAQFAGYVGGVANSHVYFIHGENGNSNQGATKSGELNSDGTNSPPAWSSLTTDGDIEDRYMPGSTPLFGIIYVLGGLDSAGNPLMSVDHAVVGATEQ